MIISHYYYHCLGLRAGENVWARINIKKQTLVAKHNLGRISCIDTKTKNRFNIDKLSLFLTRGSPSLSDMLRVLFKSLFNRLFEAVGNVGNVFSSEFCRWLLYHSLFWITNTFTHYAINVSMAHTVRMWWGFLFKYTAQTHWTRYTMHITFYTLHIS